MTDLGADAQRRLKIAVLMGGGSGEREVSLASGSQVAGALRSIGHDIVCVDTAKGVLEPAEVERLIRDGVPPAPPPPQTVDLLEGGNVTAITRAPSMDGVDVIFPALHGGTGEDGTLQALLQLTGIPYVGSDRLGCTLAMDKEVSKRLFRAMDILTPDWLNQDASLERVEDELGLPVIVKPPSGGSTLGLTLAHDTQELRDAVAEARRYESRILYERYVVGRELTVGILGDEALPVGEIIPAHEIFDYECKYQPGLAQEIFPADIPESLSDRLRATALRVHRALFMLDFSRVDFMVDDAGDAWCLEANALPGLTAQSLFPRAAAAAGIPFPELCDRIVGSALARRGDGGTPPHASG